MEILHEHLPLLAAPGGAGEGTKVLVGNAMEIRRRFMVKASQQGMRFSDQAVYDTSLAKWNTRSWLEAFVRSWRPARLAYGLALGGLCVTIGLLGVRLQKSRSNYVAAEKELTVLSAEVTRLNSRINGAFASGTVAAQAGSAAYAGKLSSTESVAVQKLEVELGRARRDYDTALERIHYLDDQLQKTSAVITGLRSELAAAQNGDVINKASGGDRLREAENALRQANEEIAWLRQGHALQVAALANQQNQIRELTDKLHSEKESSDRHRDLLATTQQIRDLMGARNLHIIDVADVDSRGMRRPFGRVFYTEGRSLVFYAYDLEKKRKSMEKFCFQAWGQVESKTGSVQNLGVFSADDQAQNRWVLRYDDPTVLARIDSVFVTVEPVGGSLKPKGQQLMYAYLRANPNHP